MDETSYSDEGVISFINEHYVPVRVDNDTRPDVNARYNMGGWPTTALLDTDGEVLAGLTYVPPDRMVELLEQVKRQRAERESSQVAPGDLVAQIYRHLLHALDETYDSEVGGFGHEPK